MGVYKNAGELPVRRDCELLTVDSKQIQSLQERMRVAKSERESRKFPRERESHQERTRSPKEHKNRR